MLARIKPLYLLPVGLVAGLLYGAVSPPPNDLTFLSVGQGDCAVFRHGGHTVLIDAGPKTEYSDAGERIVVPRLHQMGVGQVDLVLLSHPDIDHVGGVSALLRAYPACKVAISHAFAEDEKWMALVSQWNLKNDQLIWLPNKSSLKFDGCEMDVVCPPWSPGMGDNDGSMFVHLLDMKASAVFSGDAPSRVEELVSRLGDWHADVLKCGHHGSSTSTSPLWVDAVHPRYGILSVGRNNRYGHPKQHVLDVLSSKGVKIARTDREGDIVFTVHDGHFVRGE